MEKILIKQKSGTEDKPMTGMNCEVYLNDVKISSATSVSFKCDAKGVARVTLELLGNVEIKGNTEVENESKES